MLSAVVGDSASFSATARGETMTRAEAGELINGALTGNPDAIKRGTIRTRNNDLIVIESAEAAAAFNRAFDARFASGEAWQAGAKQ